MDKVHSAFFPTANRASWKLFSPFFSLLHPLCALIAVSLWWCVPSWSRPALRSPRWPCPLALFHWQVKPLIWIESVIEKFSHSRVEIKVKVSGAHTRPQSAVSLSTHLVLSLRIIQYLCLRQPPRSRITSCGVCNPNDLFHMHPRLRVVSFPAGAESV